MTKTCPCGSQKSFNACCEPLLSGDMALNPEQLMRSRYSAYVMGNLAYIKRTMCKKALNDFNETDARAWSNHIKWLSLTVLDKKAIAPNQGQVSFEARYIENNQLCCLKETSLFELINSQWYYIDGRNHTDTYPISRKQVCPCNSGKKFKRCCFLA